MHLGEGVELWVLAFDGSGRRFRVECSGLYVWFSRARKNLKKIGIKRIRDCDE